MLRYFYLLSLLICINITFCYEYTSGNELSNSPKSRKLREGNQRNRKRNIEERRIRKRHDYDMAYDKDSVAQIDVANFIKSPEDESFGENDPYEFQYNNIKHIKNYNDYGNLNGISSDEKIYSNEDYLDINAENLHESPVNLNLNDISIDNKDGKATTVFDHIHGNDLDDESLTKSNKHYQQKKCALIKLPFFSHNKSVTIKGKKNKKRKLHELIKLRKGKVSKEKIDKLNCKNNVHDNNGPYKYYKIEKRSYIERFCPACRRKFIVNQKLDFKDKRRHLLKKYYKKGKNKHVQSVNEIRNTNKVDVDDNNLITDSKVGLKESWRDKRRKRESDNRNIERQKELDELERRVESVSVIQPIYNKVNSKT